MSNFKFNLKYKELIDKVQDPNIYAFNLAKNLALLSNDAAIIRRFYQVDIMDYFKDPWILMDLHDTFFRNYEQGQAFSYFGLIPMIVQAKVNLVASGGFTCQSKNKEIDEVLNKAKDEARLQELFTGGVYWESGIGDFAYRLSFDPQTNPKPLIDIVEPHHLEVNYNRGQIVSFVIKESAEDDPKYELHEIHYLNQEGYLTIAYRYVYDDSYVAPNDTALVEQCKLHFVDVDTTERVLPFKDFVTIVYKQNPNNNKLYKGERGVPDIQGLDKIEDALTESLSDLIDAIRKGGVREYISEEIIPQDADGNDLPFNSFNKRITKTKSAGSTENPKSLYNVVQGDIRWEAHTETIKILVSTGINKAGLAPTSLGLTGLESINSSAESQEAREKTSLRTRELCLKSWEPKLTELFNKYLRIYDYARDLEPLDYSDVIKIHFNSYINPSVENITEVLVNQVDAGLKSRETAIKELNPEFDDEDAEKELLKIMAESGAQVVTDDTEQGDNMGIPPEINGNLGDNAESVNLTE